MERKAALSGTGARDATRLSWLLQKPHLNRQVIRDRVEVLVIRDTVEGKSLDKTAEELGFSRAIAFNMRHKALSALGIHEETVPTVLGGICATYVLESV